MATGTFVRGTLSATLVVLLVASEPPGALTQEQVTAEALAAYERMASGYNWTAFQHIFLDPGYRQYEAGYLAWGEAYNGRARLSRFVESGGVSHLEYLLGSAEAIYAARADRVSPSLRDDIRGRIMPTWVSKQYTNGTSYAWLAHQGMEMHPVTTAIAKIRNDPVLWPIYETRAQAIINDSIQTLDAFESEYRAVSSTRGYYYDPYLRGRLPYNMSSVAGETFIALWRATGQQRFRDRAEQIANDLKAGLVSTGDRYWWRYNVGDGAEDVSHGGINVNFMVEAYQAGIVFNSTDVARLCNTLRFIHRSGAFTTNVDGSGAVSTGNIQLTAQWLRLLYYDQELRLELWPTFQTICGSPNYLAMDAAAYFVETPEPGTMTLFSLGVVGVLARCRGNRARDLHQATGASIARAPSIE